jgi:hypothetical protein
MAGMSANPLSNISPRKMTACGCVLFATRQAFRRFTSTKIWDAALSSEPRSGYDLSLRICGSATRRMWVALASP